MSLTAAILATSFLFRQDVMYQVNNPVALQVLDVHYGTYAKQYENRWEVELTEDEIDLLAKILHLEAGNQDDAGQQLVVVVILNRIKDGRFGEGLTGVLSYPGQFSTWKRRNEAQPTTREYDNILAVLHGDVESWIYNSNYLFFNCVGNGTKIGGHYFR